MLSKNQFDVLHYLSAHPGASQRIIASGTGLSLGSINATLKDLVASGFVAANELTDAGGGALAPYKVDNAIIMAAGLSSRLAPISYERPKGLLKARGEVLIERQIKQLQDAGITDITVVIGYKKEQFFYLEDKFGVKLVVNNEYASRNNHATLMCVADKLANTYICSSDNYFCENPFEQYVWKAYYATEWTDEPTEEYCMVLGAQKRIVGVTFGGEHAWYMVGHAYFDRAFSAHFVEILKAEYNKPETKDKLWEDILAEHVKEFDMIARPYPAGTIYEFDYLDELSNFDSRFLENVDSKIFDNIVQVLGCKKSEIHDVYPLKQGLTNLSCHFATDSGEYVYRHPGIGTEKLIDRKGEVAALKVAKELGLDETFIFADPDSGWKISKFISNARNLNSHDATDIAKAMHMGRQLHESGVSVERVFDFYEEEERYKKLLLEKGPVEIEGFWEMSADFDELEQFLLADGEPKVLSHNDFFELNFLIDEDGRYYLLDWEYAGMSDYANDFGTFCVCCQLSDEEVDAALAAYFEREPTLEERRHNYALIAMAGWCWYLWSLLKEAEGDFVGEWLYIYYNHARKYLPRALELYRK